MFLSLNSIMLAEGMTRFISVALLYIATILRTCACIKDFEEVVLYNISVPQCI